MTTVGKNFWVRADDREPPTLIQSVAQIPGAIIQVTRLEYGDFEIAENVYLERKSSADFSASLVDRRIFTQIKQAEDAGIELIFLLEGDVFSGGRRIDDNALCGLLSHIASNAKLRMITVPPHMSARAIADCARHHQLGLGYTISLREPRPKDVYEGLLYALQGLPGVGRGRAEKLLAHFGSVRAVMAASVDQLAAVDGMGKKSALAIAAALDADVKRNEG